ncbi:DUF4303 domain-containing protein [Lysobacter enzymogenes]|uniref:DUF4303 domain-containing protein n=1 Tax=Lysobacter enzymogenes TaxID=69 RepID=A0A3N2RMV6_LYSEN|nr:DUF4303 domain-containing protein [Lysobacter enzymogenes]ROU08802.1 DUF4303 domain-containing protein [Lysobacter enzymogenes]
MNDMERLAEEIFSAAEPALLKLFKNEEHFYYCTLVTTGEGHAPLISAWSWEALRRVASTRPEPQAYAQLIKWSYADSPYYDFFVGEGFSKVAELLKSRPGIDDLDLSAWEKELDFRLSAMEMAMSRIDSRGVFHINQPRHEIFINVEVMPPDSSNTFRAMRLNPPQATVSWLAEAAEP